MFDGRKRSTIPHIFPTQLIIPDPCIIYLDLNHWINLSKCISGHDDGKNYQTTYDACLDAVNSGRAIFPISIFTYLEILRNQHHDQRRYIRMVIEEISRYKTILPRDIIARLEFEQVLIEHELIDTHTVPAIDYINYGVASAFGQSLVPRIVDQNGSDVTSKTIRTHDLGAKGFTTALAHGLLQLERKVIDGPSNEVDDLELRQYGWQPEKALDTFDQKAKYENELKQTLDESTNDPNDGKNWRAGRLRDVVSAREFFVEMNDIFSEVLVRHALAKESVFDLSDTNSSVRKNRNITDSMPSFDAAITLKSSYHSDANFTWTRNDIFDIYAMSVSLPYCDIVATDKAVKSQIQKNKLDRLFRTKVIAKIQELPALLL